MEDEMGFNMMAAGDRSNRRQAVHNVPKLGKTQSTPPPSIMAFSNSTFGGGFGKADEEDSSKVSEWYEKTADHRTLAGAYQGVKILMSDKGFGGTTHKWINTGLSGALRLIQVKEVVDSYPVVMIQLQATDPAQIERAIVFEYELPFNFGVESLSDKMAAISLANGEYVGFHFTRGPDKVSFMQKIDYVAATLNINLEQVVSLKLKVQAQLQTNQMDQIGEHIDCENLLSGQNEEQRAEDLRKILILAGLKLETELGDPETLALISEVLENFDPTQDMNEDEAMFSTRFVDFERKNRTDGPGKQREMATKRVSESFHMKRKQREVEEEKERVERDLKKAQTDALQAQFEKLQEESRSLKASIKIQVDKEKAEKEAKIAEKEAAKQKIKAEKEAAKAKIIADKEAAKKTAADARTSVKKGKEVAQAPKAAPPRPPPAPPAARPRGYRPSKPRNLTAPHVPAPSSAVSSTPVRPPPGRGPPAPPRPPPSVGANPPRRGPPPPPPKGGPRSNPRATRARGPANIAPPKPKPKPRPAGIGGPQMSLQEQLVAQQKIMREKAEAKKKAIAEGNGPPPKKKLASEMTLFEQLQEQQKIMKEKAEAKKKAAAAGSSAANAKAAAPKEKSFAEIMEEQRQVMREKANLRKMTAAGGAAAASVTGNSANSAASSNLTRQVTVAQVIAKEEKRLTDSHVAGVTMDISEQLSTASKLLKPAAKEKLNSFGKATRSAAETGIPNEESKESASNSEDREEFNKAAVFSLTAKITQAIQKKRQSQMNQNADDNTNSDDSHLSEVSEDDD